MSHNLKAGDLAILKSSEAEHLVGSVVELIEYVGNELYMPYAGTEALNPGRDRIWWERFPMARYLKAWLEVKLTMDFAERTGCYLFVVISSRNSRSRGRWWNE